MIARVGKDESGEVLSFAGYISYPEVQEQAAFNLFQVLADVFALAETHVSKE